jgi:hypothetical protein
LGSRIDACTNVKAFPPVIYPIVNWMVCAHGNKSLRKIGYR